MRILLSIILLWLALVGRGSAQSQLTPSATDTLTPVATPASDLLAELVDSSEQQPLLPHKMLFTQRVFWGPKGLLRITDIAPLNPEARASELKLRRKMLVGHQVMGFVTLAGFVAQGLVGAKLYNAGPDNYDRLKNLHGGIATGVNITYATTALLSLVAPPKVIGERRGFSSIKLHKYLSIIHLTGMVATNVLAGMVQNDYRLKPYHRAAAYTTFASFALAVVAIKI